MWAFLKHRFTKQEEQLVKGSAEHLVIAVLAGVVLAIGLLGWQLEVERGRIQDSKQKAAEAALSPPGSTPPNTAKIGGSFDLINQDGKTVHDSDFAGKYLLIYFGYTNCPDMCPTGLQSMSLAMNALGNDADKVQPLFITVDPARDTPERLKEYDSAFHTQIIGLTGPADEIAAVAKEYQVYYEKGDGDQDYEVNHSSLIYLMNPSGNLVTTFDEEVDPNLIVAALKKAWGAQPQGLDSPRSTP
jgi:protein SCO1/2